jgi:hypothetical protein
MPLLDEFPSTARTELFTLLEESRVDEAQRRVLEHAYRPLCLYAERSSLRRIAEPDDLVAGFLASRFGRDGYLARWRAADPPIPLRRWLVNGLLFHARERIDDDRRARRASDLAAPTRVEPEPWRTLERAWRDGVLQTACDRVASRYRDEARDDAWRLFTRHILEGASYPALERELGIDARSAPMITRTALRRLRSEIESILADEFPDDADRARELEAILFDDEQTP